ncbi:MAG: ATP-binding protein [Methanothrix sp.]
MQWRIDSCRNGEGDDQSRINLFKSDLDKISARLCEPNSSTLGITLLDDLISDNPCSLFLQDRDLRYTWLSDGPLGVDGLLALGKTDEDIFSPVEADRQRKIKEKVMHTGNPARTEVHLLEDGMGQYLDCIYYPWQDEDGRTQGVAGCIKDGTERRIAQIQLQGIVKEVKSSPAAIVLFDFEGRIVYANPLLLQSCGYHDAFPERVPSIFDFTNGNGKSKLQEVIIPALLSQGNWQGELPIQGTDSQYYIAEMICVSVDSGGSVYFLANFCNLSDSIRAEEALLLDELGLVALIELNPMDEAILKELADYAIQAGAKLTGSEFGYLAFMDESESIILMSHWSKDPMPEDGADQNKMAYHLVEPCLWGEALKRRKAVIFNDNSVYCSKSHLSPDEAWVLRYISVPIMDKGKIVIVAAVGNKGEEYNDADVRQLTLLMSGMYKLIQRRRTDEELRQRDLLLRQVATATTNHLLATDPDAIKKALGILGISIGSDRITILESAEWMGTESVFEEPIQWLREPGEPFRGRISWDQFIGWQDALSRGNPIQGITSKVIDPGRKLLEDNGIISFLFLPVFIEGRFCAVISIDDCHLERRWTENEVAILQAAAESIGNALLRRRTEVALRESKRMLTTLMSNLPGMAYRCRNDRQRTMEFVSDGCLELTGRSSPELLRNSAISYVDLIHPDDQDRVWSEIQQATEKRTPFRLAYRINAGSETKWVWEHGQGIFDATGKLLALEGFIHDITERKLAEDARKRTQEDLEMRVSERTAWLLRINRALNEEMLEHKETEKKLLQAQQAADAASRSMGEFLAYMSHEIRTPMNSVIGLAGLLLETNLSPEQRDYVQIIHSSGDALLSIINDILDFSKINEGKMKLELEPFSLRKCIDRSINMVAAKAAEKGLEIGYDLDDLVPQTVVGDSARLQQILVNLLGNAVKFTERGRVSLGVKMGDEPGMLHFSVADTGIGISRSDMKKLFHSFSQADASTSRKYGGTGLGLSISRKLAEQMGGRIWVESEVGRGSTFHFQIKAEESSGDDASNQLLAGKRIIALVGSEEPLRELISQCQRLGMQIQPVVSAGEAEEMVPGSFDAAIVDIDVPGAEMILPDIARRLPTIILATHDGQFPERVTLAKPVSEIGLKLAMKDALFSNSRSAREPGYQEVDHRDLKILLAEDNPVNRKVALLMLNKLGYKADVVSNGAEAVQALSHKHYDVVLMDVQMPKMDGLEATRAILNMNLAASPRILAMTAYALEGDRKRCLDAGMDGYISKPVQLDELRAALQALNIGRQRAD